MANDKRLLGKREKCRYMYEDLNVDCIALDLNHDLVQDKRKHAGLDDDFEENPEFPALSAVDGDFMAGQGPVKILVQSRNEIRQLACGKHPMEGRDLQFRPIENENLFPNPMTAGQKRPPMPAKLIGLAVHSPLAAYNMNALHVGYQAFVHRPDDFSYLSGHQGGRPIGHMPFGHRLENQRDLRLGHLHRESAAFVPNYQLIPKMNSMSFNKMADVTADDLNTDFKDGHVGMVANHRYRSVRGLLYQVMDDIEEYELLLK